MCRVALEGQEILLKAFILLDVCRGALEGLKTVLPLVKTLILLVYSYVSVCPGVLGGQEILHQPYAKHLSCLYIVEVI